MYPVIELGRLALPTKPLLLLVGLYFVLWLGSRSASLLGIHGDIVWNWGLLSVLGGLVIGRAAYALRYPQAYLASPLSLLSPRPASFLPEAAVLGGLVVGALYLRRYRVPLAAFADAMAPALTLGWALYALANFLAGDAYGTPTDVPWAVEMWGAPRHPVQLYEMGAALLTTIWLIGRPAPRGRGLWGWRLLLAYGLTRLLLEPWRGDSVLLPGGFRLYQLVGLALALLALWGLSRSAPSARDLAAEPDQGPDAANA